MKSLAHSIARVAHEVNMAYRQSLGDYTQVPWELAPSWQQESAVSGVEFHLANPLASPSDSHENWMKEKIEAGWVHGEEKDPEKKTHPCLVPYDQLPQEQRSTDFIFIGVVRAIAREMAR